MNRSGTSTADLPTSLEVPADTMQLYFAAKAGTKSSLAVKNITKEPSTSVACIPVPEALYVPGANNYGWDENTQTYTEAKGAAKYDLWYINLDKAFSDITKLELTWA